MKPVDSHYCQVCGNRVVRSSSVCLHCAATIDWPEEEKPKTSGCLGSVIALVILSLALALAVRAIV